MDEPSEHDLKKARELVETHGPLVGTADSLHETVAQLVARAIAIGREEGLRIAAKPRRRRATGKDSSPPELTEWPSPSAPHPYRWATERPLARRPRMYRRAASGAGERFAVRGVGHMERVMASPLRRAFGISLGPHSPPEALCTRGSPPNDPPLPCTLVRP